MPIKPNLIRSEHSSSIPVRDRPPIPNLLEDIQKLKIVIASAGVNINCKRCNLPIVFEDKMVELKGGWCHMDCNADEITKRKSIGPRFV